MKRMGLFSAADVKDIEVFCERSEEGRLFQGKSFEVLRWYLQVCAFWSTGRGYGTGYHSEYHRKSVEISISAEKEGKCESVDF